jgi:DNA-binding IclR family transcriptional regulator
MNGRLDEVHGLKGKQKRYRIQVLERTAVLLDCFASGFESVGVTELSRRVHLHKSTVHRLLMVLEELRWVAGDGMGRYHLGPELWRIGRRAMGAADPRQLAKPVLEDLVCATGETAHFVVLDGKQALYLEKVECDRSVRMPSFVGRRNPLHCTAVGKVLLANLPPPNRDRLLAEMDLRRFTPRTITAKRNLLRALDAVRKKGYALDDQELEMGLRCIAAPVRDHYGDVFAAVSISGPIYRISAASVPALAEEVILAGEKMSRKFGWSDEAGTSGKHDVSCCST